MGRWRRGGLAMLAVAGSALVLGAALQPSRTGWLGMPVEARDLIAVPPLAMEECLRQTVDSAGIVVGGHQRPRWILSHRDSIHVRDCMERVGDQVAIRGEMIRLVGLRAAIPEYNDEQRFALADGKRFGPRVAIFASPNLDGFRQEEQVKEHGRRGMLAAVVYVDTNASIANSLSHAAYTRLELDAGLNCVWLVLTEPGEWSARITRGKALDSDGTDWACAEWAVQKQLAVERSVFGGRYAFHEIPPAARFEFAVDGLPLLGVKCLTGWCTIGPARPGSGVPAFTKARPPSATAQGIAAPRALLDVPGWHDGQILANFDPETKEAIPGTVRATLIPADTGYRDAPTIPGGMQRFGYLVIHNAVAGTRYEGWGLVQGVNEVMLEAINGPPHYRVVIVNELGRKVWTNVLRHPHVDAAVPPTARFRWMSLDDGIWFGCGQGCCRADGLL